MPNEMVYKTIAGLDLAGAVDGDEYVEIFQDGKSVRVSVDDLRKFNSYSVGVGTSTTLSIDNTVTTIDNTAATAKTITPPSNLPANRAMTLVVVIRGKAGAITWGPGINWSGNMAPVLADNVTVVVLLWDGTAVHGSAGPSY